MNNLSDTSAFIPAMPSAPAPASGSPEWRAQPSINVGIPSLQTHITDTWNTFTASILNLILLGFTSFLSFFVLMVLIVGGVVATGLSTLNTTEFTTLLSEKEFDKAFTLVPPSLYISIGIGIFVLFVVGTLLQTIFGIASVGAVGWAESKPTLGSLIKVGIQKMGWFILLNIISSFFIFGSFGVFFIGGVIASIFFGFAFYELILNEKRPIAALKASVTLVSENFGVIFVRYLVFFLAYLIIFALIPELFRAINSSLAAVYQVITAILSLFVGTISICYSVVLYKYIRKNTSETTERSGIWVGLILTAIVGWLLFLILGSFIFKVAKTAFDKKMSETNSTSQTEFSGSDSSLPAFLDEDALVAMNIAPSNCGVSIPLPETTSLDDKPRYWMYEERYLEPTAFRTLAPESVTKQGVLGAFVAFKTDDDRFKATDQTFKTGFTGYHIICTNNPKKLDLAEFTQDALSNKNYTVTQDGGTQLWGEVPTQAIFIEGLTKGDYYKEPAYLAVTPDKTRLILIQPWNISSSDSMKKELQKDLQTISNNLKFRAVNKPLNGTTGN